MTRQWHMAVTLGLLVYVFYPVPVAAAQRVIEVFSPLAALAE